MQNNNKKAKTNKEIHKQLNTYQNMQHNASKYNQNSNSDNSNADDKNEHYRTHERSTRHQVQVQEEAKNYNFRDLIIVQSPIACCDESGR